MYDTNLFDVTFLEYFLYVVVPIGLALMLLAIACESDDEPLQGLPSTRHWPLDTELVLNKFDNLEVTKASEIKQ